MSWTMPLRIARPITLWALHFVAVYALISAACAPRQLIGVDTLRLGVMAVTGGCALVLLVWLMLGVRTARKADSTAPQQALHRAIVWSALISLLAVVFNLLPVVTLASCTG